jgi:hypothetical protein
MGLNAEKLESRNNQVSPKSLVHQHSISESIEENLILSKDIVSQRKNQTTLERKKCGVGSALLCGR